MMEAVSEHTYIFLVLQLLYIQRMKEAYTHTLSFYFLSFLESSAIEFADDRARRALNNTRTQKQLQVNLYSTHQGYFIYIRHKGDSAA